MTQLLLINEVTYRKGLNNIGDIVGKFDDTHLFSENEKVAFDIVTVPETKLVIEAIAPKIKRVYKTGVAGWSDKLPEEKQVWQDASGDWFDLAECPKYLQRYDKNLKQYFENVTADPKNTETVITIEIALIETKI